MAETASGGEETTAPPNKQVVREPSPSLMAEDIRRTALESTRSVRDLVSHYRSYEDAFFNKITEKLMIVREHPAATLGVAGTAAFLLLPGPRRFLFRQTLNRLRSEESRVVRAEKNIKDFDLSVDLMVKESKKLLERAASAEAEMLDGRDRLRVSGKEIRRLKKSVYGVEAQAADLMDMLREIPGREALKLRAEVASMASLLKQQRIMVDKQIMKLCELGVPVK